jgi:prepilin-type N-terminal cleavage/methylation domain-containing protein
MKTMASLERGFTIVELMLASTIVAIVSGLAYGLVIKQSEATYAEANRQNAKIAARVATFFLKDLFRSAGGYMVISSDMSGIAFGDPSSTSYVAVQNTCISAPPRAARTPPKYTSLPDCPAPCSQGMVPQIKVIYQQGAVSRERVFPTAYEGLHGAIVCARQFGTLLTFPAELRAADYSLMVYVGWNTNHSGTSEATLWTVDGTFLTGGRDQRVILKERGAAPL